MARTTKVATEAGITLDGKHYVLGDIIDADREAPPGPPQQPDKGSMLPHFDHFTALLRERVVEWDEETAKKHTDRATAHDRIPSFWRLLGNLNRETGLLMGLNDALLRRDEVSTNMAAMAKVTTEIAFWAMLMYTRRRLDAARRVRQVMERSANGGS